jgi:hypothetical protein
VLIPIAPAQDELLAIDFLEIVEPERMGAIAGGDTLEMHHLGGWAIIYFPAPAGDLQAEVGILIVGRIPRQVETEHGLEVGARQ